MRSPLARAQLALLPLMNWARLGFDLLFLRALRFSPAIMALAINQSRTEPQMLRMLASHIVPRQKELPVKIGRLHMSTIDDLDQASAVTLNKATTGKISLSAALGISDLIDNRRRVLETQDLERTYCWSTAVTPGQACRTVCPSRSVRTVCSQGNLWCRSFPRSR